MKREDARQTRCGRKPSYLSHYNIKMRLLHQNTKIRHQTGKNRNCSCCSSSWTVLPAVGFWWLTGLLYGKLTNVMVYSNVNFIKNSYKNLRNGSVNVCVSVCLFLHVFAFFLMCLIVFFLPHQ